MNCNVPYTPAILSGSVTFLEHFHSVFVCFRYVTQISVPVPVPVTFLGDLPGRKSGLRIAGGRKMPMWWRDYSSKWHFLQARNLLKLVIMMLMVMVARLGVKMTFFAPHRPTEQCLLAPWVSGETSQTQKRKLDFRIFLKDKKFWCWDFPTPDLWLIISVGIGETQVFVFSQVAKASLQYNGNTTVCVTWGTNIQGDGCLRAWKLPKREGS